MLTQFVLPVAATLGVLLALVILLRRLGDASSKAKVAHPYAALSSLLTPAEKSFYHCLRQALPPETVLMVKVRLADILTVSSPDGHRDRQSHFNRISAKHIDFVLAHATTLAPLILIELDDRSHGRPRARRRDSFVDAAAQAAGLPLIRQTATRSYNVREVSGRINGALAGMALPTPPADARGDAPPESLTATTAATPPPPEAR